MIKGHVLECIVKVLQTGPEEAETSETPYKSHNINVINMNFSLKHRRMLLQLESLGSCSAKSHLLCFCL